MPEEDDPRLAAKPQELSPAPAKPKALSWVKSLIRGKASNTNMLEEALEDYIEELKESRQDEASADSQRTLIRNVLKTHDLRVDDIMVPRADITAIEESATPADLARIFSENPFSRLPVYKSNLDHITGTIHIKDILACLLVGKSYTLAELVREPVIVHPSLPVMDLFLMMRTDKKHMALVVDEHGGIDGLVTINDVIEAIVGDIEDEFDSEEQPLVVEKPDGSLLVDARIDIEEFEERYGNFLTADEREDIDTLAGLAFSMAGRIPKRGDILRHPSGLVMEVTDANARRVSRVRIRTHKKSESGDEV